MRTKKKNDLREVEVYEEDPIREIYHNTSRSKDPIDFVIEERIREDQEKRKIDPLDKVGVLNRLFQLVRYDKDFEFAISNEFYYLYHLLSSSDQHLFEIWFNKYR